MNKKDKSWGIIIGLSLSILLINFTAFAWTRQSQAPPGGNVSPPLDTSTSTQVKGGALGVHGVLQAFSNLIVHGNVGIGTMSPGARLDVYGDIILGRSQAIYGARHRQFILSGAWNNLYLAPRNDANTDWLWDAFVINSNGNVGIGTVVPQARLDVAGAIRVGSQDICNANTSGAIRYISTPGEQRFEGCNGVSWLLIAQVHTPPPPLVRRIFVTSTQYHGNLGGLAGADNICMTRAKVANLPGTWRALLGIDLVDARRRLEAPWKPLVTMDGRLIAQHEADLLWSGRIGNPINRNEFNQFQESFVLTGTYARSRFWKWPRNCRNWLSSSNSSEADVGYSNSTDKNWINKLSWTCNREAALYCFEQ